MINQKYKLLKESLRAICNENINILILVGEAGMGKTFDTLEYLKENSIDYTYINSYSTPLSFYEILYKNAEKKIVIFDDVSSIGNPIILSLLKSACWTSNNKRIVSYYSTTKVLNERELPESFEFDARVILIFNERIKGYKPIINRGVKINFNFTFKNKLEIFNNLKAKANIDDEVLKYVLDHCNESTRNLNIRSLVILSNLKRANFDFRLFASEILSNNPEIELLKTLDYKSWSKKTGRSIKTYYRMKAKYNIQ